MRLRFTFVMIFVKNLADIGTIEPDVVVSVEALVLCILSDPEDSGVIDGLFGTHTD